MIKASDLVKELKNQGTDFFTGVPDSLLKDFYNYIGDNVGQERDIIAANEGAALALATGHHLATGNIALVYLQNSGIGNLVNPLTSRDCAERSTGTIFWRFKHERKNHRSDPF